MCCSQSRQIAPGTVSAPMWELFALHDSPVRWGFVKTSWPGQPPQFALPGCLLPQQRGQQHQRQVTVRPCEPWLAGPLGEAHGACCPENV